MQIFTHCGCIAWLSRYVSLSKWLFVWKFLVGSWNQVRGVVYWWNTVMLIGRDKNGRLQNENEMSSEHGENALWVLGSTMLSSTVYYCHMPNQSWKAYLCVQGLLKVLNLWQLPMDKTFHWINTQVLWYYMAISILIHVKASLCIQSLIHSWQSEKKLGFLFCSK